MQSEDGKYRLGKYTFSTAQEYNEALAELRLIKSIMDKADVHKKENAKVIIKAVNDGKMTFKTPVGTDFVKSMENIAGEKVRSKIPTAAMAGQGNPTAANARQGKPAAAKTGPELPAEPVEYELVVPQSRKVSNSLAVMFAMSFAVTLIFSFLGLDKHLYAVIVLVELVIGCGFLHETGENIRKIEEDMGFKSRDSIWSWIVPVAICIPFFAFPFLLIVLVVVQLLSKFIRSERWLLGNLLHGLFFVLIQGLFALCIRMGQMIALDSFMDIENMVGRVFILPVFILLSIVFSGFLSAIMCRVMKSQFSIAVRCAFTYPMEVAGCLIMLFIDIKADYHKFSVEYERNEAERRKREYEAAKLQQEESARGREEAARQKASQTQSSKQTNQTQTAKSGSNTDWASILLGTAAAAAIIVGGIAISSAVAGAAPALVGVHAYTRRKPGGGISYVRSHVRTAPDAILRNNLSFR